MRLKTRSYCAACCARKTGWTAHATSAGRCGASRAEEAQLGITDEEIAAALGDEDADDD